MALEEKYAIGLAVLSLVLLGVGWLVAKRLSVSSPGTFRMAVPGLAAATLLAYFIFVFIARVHVKG